MWSIQLCYQFLDFLSLMWTIDFHPFRDLYYKEEFRSAVDDLLPKHKSHRINVTMFVAVI